MNKITRHKNSNFTIISNVFLKDKYLSIKAKGFLAVIMGLPDDWDFSISGICSILQEGKTAVYNVIDELRQKGYCEYKILRNDKGLVIGNDYSFSEEPIYEMEVTLRLKRKMDNQKKDYPETDNREMDNKPQLSTKDKQVLNEVMKEKRKEIKKKNSNYLPTDEERNIFDEFRKKYKGAKGGLDTMFKFFISQNEDWREVLPKLDYAVTKENELRSIANSRKKFFPEPQVLKTYLNKNNRTWERYLEDYSTTYKDEYRPQLDGFNMVWSDNVGCYVTTYELNSLMFVDGYKDEDRPECAVVMIQGVRYRWSKSENKWVKK